MKRFNLEGTTYYQQMRKCGRSSCHCKTGNLHGPYWYARSPIGKIQYIGKTLPDHIDRTRQAYAEQRQAMSRARSNALAKCCALERLILNRALRKGDRDVLTELGFADCLVSRPQPGQTQD